MNDSARSSRWLPLAVFGLIAALLAVGVWLSRNPDRDADSDTHTHAASDC